jgi:predicted nuclease with RNAse H fold
MKNFIGVDFGAKTSGLTRIAIKSEDELIIHATEKNKDADITLSNFINDNEVEYCFIDAPLSLPGVYNNRNGRNNFFFRDADKELRAMSPMFLGGLTARAMQMQYQLKNTCTFIEVYPTMAARRLRLKNYFNDDIENCFKELESKFEIKIMSQAIDKHSIDAVLAWNVGFRYFNDNVSTAGNKEEGIIYY